MGFHYVALVLVAVGLCVGCRNSPVAPSSGPSLDDLAVQGTASPGSDVGNRVLFPQSPAPSAP